MWVNYWLDLTNWLWGFLIDIVCGFGASGCVATAYQSEAQFSPKTIIVGIFLLIAAISIAVIVERIWKGDDD